MLVLANGRSIISITYYYSWYTNPIFSWELDRKQSDAKIIPTENSFILGFKIIISFLFIHKYWSQYLSVWNWTKYFFLLTNNWFLDEQLKRIIYIVISFPIQHFESLIFMCLHVAVQDHQGYPSGSMVDFACDYDGSPILAVSSLAVHSKVSMILAFGMMHLWIHILFCETFQFSTFYVSVGVYFEHSLMGKFVMHAESIGKS